MKLLYCRHFPVAKNMKMHPKRYNRQIALPEIGISGQQKLAHAKVLIIGAGGLGSPVLQNLAAAGVSCIGIVDGDVVEETNLHRQYLYTLNDCGKRKAEVAAEAVLKQNPEVKVISYTFYFTKTNAFEILSDYQIIVDCTDNLETRYLINDVSLVKKIPMVYASIHKFEGQLSVLNYKNGPSYRCLFPENESLNRIDNCADSGVLGVLPNVLGGMQANEILKIILEIGSILNGELLLYNGLDNSTQTIGFQRNETEIKKGIQNGFSILNAQGITEVGVLSSSDFITEIQNKNNLVIDIRESYEEPKLEMENSHSVPLEQLGDFLKNINRNQKIILFCQNGNRSKLAANYLQKNGFINLFHLHNGIEALEKTNI
jgi:molybdopterin/thiamine biosynthesis adenylyltransferase/rhodanese-related sulfurtransferase